MSHGREQWKKELLEKMVSKEVLVLPPPDFCERERQETNRAMRFMENFIAELRSL